MMPNIENNSWYLSPLMAGRYYPIDDSGGFDFFDFSSWSGRYTYDLFVDLRPGAYYNPVEHYNFGYSLYLTPTTVIEYARGGAGNDRIVGNYANNWLNAGSGNDRVWGLEGNDQIMGNEGSDQIFGGYGDDVLNGDGDTDYLYGEIGADVLYGGDNRDHLYGGQGNDALSGGAGSDLLYGGAGADRFMFAEVMSGTNGAIRLFVPNDESRVSAPDFIMGFGGAGNLAGDVIDLREIDANINGHPNPSANEEFVFRGTGSSRDLKSLWLVDEGGNTAIYGNTFNGSEPEFKIVIVDGDIGAWQYTAADFYL